MHGVWIDMECGGFLLVTEEAIKGEVPPPRKWNLVISREI